MISSDALWHILIFFSRYLGAIGIANDHTSSPSSFSSSSSLSLYCHHRWRCRLPMFFVVVSIIIFLFSLYSQSRPFSLHLLLSSRPLTLWYLFVIFFCFVFLLFFVLFLTDAYSIRMYRHVAFVSFGKYVVHIHLEKKVLKEWAISDRVDT